MTAASNVDVVRTALDAYNARGENDLCEGIRDWIHDFDQSFDAARLETSDVSEIDSRVLALGRFVADDRAQDFGLVCELEGGRVRHWTPYLSHGQAIGAAEMLEC
jgi:hypothetical protein